MANLVLSAFTDYVSDWLYYLICLLGWVQLSCLSLLFAVQTGLEIKLIPRRQNGGLHILIRSFVFFISLGVFWWATQNLFLQRLLVDPKTYWGLGLAAERNGAYPKAISYFRKAAEEEKNLAFQMELAEALYQNKQEREALSIARSLPRETMQKYLLTGRIYFSLENYKQAKQFFAMAHKKAPDDVIVQVWLGETNLKLHDQQGAFKAFTQALKNPNLPRGIRIQISKKIQALKGEK